MSAPQRRRYDLAERLIDLSVRIIDVVEKLPRTRAGNHAADQLLRAGTSPMTNYAEAQSAESRKDFIHKIKVSLKELRETRAWLLVTQRKGIIKSQNVIEGDLAECNEPVAIFAASVGTAERNRGK